MFQPHRKGVNTPCVQLVKSLVSIQETIKDLPVGGRIKWFVKQWEERGAHPFQVDVIQQLSRSQYIISGYSDVNKNNALSTLTFLPKMP